MKSFLITNPPLIGYLQDFSPQVSCTTLISTIYNTNLAIKNHMTLLHKNMDFIPFLCTNIFILRIKALACGFLLIQMALLQLHFFLNLLVKMLNFPFAVERSFHIFFLCFLDAYLFHLCNCTNNGLW